MSLSRSLRSRLLALAAVTSATLIVPTAEAATGPVQKSFMGAFPYSLQHGAVDPVGVNNWSCKPAAGRKPVVLIHGYIANSYVPWAYMGPQLKNSGLCVYAINYSTQNPSGALSLFGTGPIRQSAKELASYVDRVTAATGASQVDLVGHSEGSLLARTYLQYEGGAGKVDNLISIAGLNNGTSLQGIGTLGKQLNVLGPVGQVAGQAAADMVTGSPFMKALNAGGQTVPGVIYTNIVTKYDEIATPYTTGYIVDNRAGATVRNINLQNGCGTNFAEHLSSTYSARTLWYVRSALRVTGQRRATCDIQLPLF